MERAAEPEVGSGRAGALLAALTLALWVAFAWQSTFVRDGARHATLIDDAMISMRYARNLVRGHGLVWNAGEPPVEGYSNLLWTLAMAGAQALPVGVDGQVLAVVALGAICLAVNLLVVARLALRLAGGAAWAAVLACTVTALNFPLTFWALRGMEVGAAALAVNGALLAAFALEERVDAWRLAGLAAAAGLGVLVRSDLLPPLGLIAAYAVIAVPAGARVRVAAAGLGALALAYGGQTAIRLHVYGDLLPNTYYLKVVGVAASERVLRGAIMFVDVALRDLVPLLAVLAVAVGAPEVEPRRRITLLMGLFVLQCAYSVWVGGDYVEYEVGGTNRFVTLGVVPLTLAAVLRLQVLMREESPARLTALMAALGAIALACWGATLFGVSLFVPYLNGGRDWRSASGIAGALPFAVCGAALLAGRRRWAGAIQRASPSSALVLGLVLVLLMSGDQHREWMLAGVQELSRDAGRRDVGCAIHDATTEDAVVAMHAAGQVAFYADRRAIDLLGKSDRVVAHGPPTGPFFPGHNKTNFAWSLGELKPDVVSDISPVIKPYVAAHGLPYDELCGVLVRRGSSRVDRARLAARLLP